MLMLKVDTRGTACWCLLIALSTEAYYYHVGWSKTKNLQVPILTLSQKIEIIPSCKDNMPRKGQHLILCLQSSSMSLIISISDFCDQP